jgi:hypothetical protein
LRECAAFLLVAGRNFGVEIDDDISQYRTFADYRIFTYQTIHQVRARSYARAREDRTPSNRRTFLDVR